MIIVERKFQVYVFAEIKSKYFQIEKFNRILHATFTARAIPALGAVPNR